MDLIPEEPAPNTRGAFRDTYLKWLNDCTMVRCIMRVAMNNEFSHKFEEVQLEEILKVLNNSFGTPDNFERYKTSCAVFNAKMRRGLDNRSYIEHDRTDRAPQ